jgi:hypothetical protein
MIQATLTYEYDPTREFPFWCTASATAFGQKFSKKGCGSSWDDCRTRALESLERCLQNAHEPKPLPPDEVVPISIPEAVCQG